MKFFTVAAAFLACYMAQSTANAQMAGSDELEVRGYDSMSDEAFFARYDEGDTSAARFSDDELEFLARAMRPSKPPPSPPKAAARSHSPKGAYKPPAPGAPKPRVKRVARYADDELEFVSRAMRPSKLPSIPPKAAARSHSGRNVPKGASKPPAPGAPKPRVKRIARYADDELEFLTRAMRPSKLPSIPPKAAARSHSGRSVPKGASKPPAPGAPKPRVKRVARFRDDELEFLTRARGI